MDRRRLTGILLVAAAGLAGLAWLLRPAAVPAEVARLVRAPFVETVDEQGKTRIRDHYAVVAPLAGELDRIALTEGDAVLAGQVLAVLRPVAPALLDRRTAEELGRRVEAARAA
ncbi:MAG: biotin/lipoyl-binding protein, partial [Proteobacteria bacterium]|nr:biotin/lipoyl-binding protein [Pseudomonadota bacterium]